MKNIRHIRLVRDENVVLSGAQVIERTTQERLISLVNKINIFLCFPLMYTFLLTTNRRQRLVSLVTKYFHAGLVRPDRY